MSADETVRRETVPRETVRSEADHAGFVAAMFTARRRRWVMLRRARWSSRSPVW